MSAVRRYAEILRDHVDRAGWRGAVEFHSKLYWRKLRTHPGESIYEREWDVLVVVDACRYDLFREVAGDYDFLGDVERFDSVASATWRWMEETFVPEHGDAVRETTYLCANPFSGRVCSGDAFADLDELWAYAWDDSLGTVHPRSVTDRAIRVGREASPRRLLVHYLQPHAPFVASGEAHERTAAEFGRGEDDVWDRLQRREVSVDDVWRKYRANLEFVLDEVGLLLENLDADRAVVTSDHGNARGEWGLYGHPPDLALPVLRSVPWCETTAADERTHRPERVKTGAVGADSDTVADRLASLGYR